MTVINLERAHKHLEAWLEAELAVSTGQSYSIGTRSLTRANISEIRKQVTYWRSEISRLQGRGRRKVMRAMPLDL
ncbi:DUF6148 family protein [Bacillus solitudinis]|uniref:DUF6148 family protein n=1 Tax=Bacillus solitudinis TaxID=2014074 RepID=UPI000C249B46|nr:DUF6148 family protein [Bacillus solitudinis]